MGARLINPEPDESESVHPGLEQVRAIPLFAGLDEADLSQISTGLLCERIRRDQLLYRQGTDADSAFFVQSGRLRVISALPGGGETHLADLGPGAMLGETSLVSTGVRSASVRAQTDVAGFFMERSFFRAALAQANPSASKMLGRLIRIVCERIRAQYVQIVSTAGRDTGVSCRKVAAPEPPINRAGKACSFPYQAYLPRLDFFSGFQPDDIRKFESEAYKLDLPRDTVLFNRSDSADSCFFVVRGALELCICRNDGSVPLAILGPGTFLGTTEIILPGVRVACGRVREDATVFELSAGKLVDLLSGRSRCAIKFQLAFCESLIADLSKINKRAARTTSQASLNGVRLD